MVSERPSRLRSSLLAGAGLILSLTACSAHREAEKPDLRSRIVAANKAAYCQTQACVNPHILAIEKGFVVTTFVSTKPQYQQVRVSELQDYLVELPMSAWPRGPVITISPSDDVYSAQALKQNLATAKEVCRSLGLEVQFRPGG